MNWMIVFWVCWAVAGVVAEVFALLTHHTPLTDVALYAMDRWLVVRCFVVALLCWLVFWHWTTEPRLTGELGVKLRHTRKDDGIVAALGVLLAVFMGRARK